MTKRHLRPWVHIVLLMLVLFSVLYIEYTISAKAVNDCIESGQNEKVCDELWK